MELERVSYVPSDISLIARRSTVVKTRREDAPRLTADEVDDRPLKWINIIFLPFQFWWQTIMLYIFCVRLFFAPMESVFPFLSCSAMVEENTILQFLKVSFNYNDIMYAIDTFLYIMHRQMAEEGMKREYLPKPGLLLSIDLIALIPFYSLFGSFDCKNEISFWPNILLFIDLIPIYRVGMYFSLNIGHSYFKLLLGYMIMFLLLMNAANCFVLLYKTDLCKNCTKDVGWHFDGRAYTARQFASESENALAIYIYGIEYVFSLMIHYLTGNNAGRTLTEYILAIAIMILGYVLLNFSIMPKLFGENILRMRPIYSFHPRVKIIVEETQRRSSSPSAHVSVEKYYQFIWEKRDGIIEIPQAIHDLPLCMNIDIMQDLVWAIFYHSPTFRNTSIAFKRWLSRHVRIKFKLPNERFFTGQQCHTDLFYIRSGILQLISDDDSATPMISVGGGTLFGDSCFFVPPIQKKVIIRCLTYCQFFTISRTNILRSLHLFPEDRRRVFKLTIGKLQHARELHEFKEKVMGTDRTEYDGIVWIKERWWELADIFQQWKISSLQREGRLPPEKEDYHCAKYIGQLVLMDEQILGEKSVFFKFNFPFVMSPSSKYILLWRRFVKVIVYFVLCLFPPNLLREWLDKPLFWFVYVKYTVDLIYAGDVLLSLITAPESDENKETNLRNVMYERVKRKSFILDMLSTFFVEKCLTLLLGDTYAGVISYNRLLKTYIIFDNIQNKPTWHRNLDPLKRILLALLLSSAVHLYCWPFTIYAAAATTYMRSKMEISIHFGNLCYEVFVAANLSTGTQCTVPSNILEMLEVPVGWLVKLNINIFSIDETLFDVIVVSFVTLFRIVLFLYYKMKIIATMYLKYLNQVRYRYFVSTLNKHYISMRLRPDLLNRLNLYLDCHWKHHYGSDILYSNILQDQPYEIYWKLHGKIAINIISNSKAFRGANPDLIRELAREAKFLILPKSSILSVFDKHIHEVIWVFRGFIKKSSYTAKGEISTEYNPKGNIISLFSVFLSGESLKTFSTASDAEILYIDKNKFHRILKRFPKEWCYFNKLKNELTPAYYKLIKKFRHDYEKNASRIAAKMQPAEDTFVRFANRVTGSISEFRNSPESTLFQLWMAFRVFVLFLTLILRSYYHMSDRDTRIKTMAIIYATDVVAILHIIIRMFVPYYDQRGIIISDIPRCAFHYITRSFLVDLTGTILGVEEIIRKILPTKTTERLNILMGSFPYIHLYLLTGFFNYHADKPSGSSNFLMVVKWFMVLVTIGATACRIFYVYCIEVVSGNNQLQFQEMRITDQCWIQTYYTIWLRKLNSETRRFVVANTVKIVTNYFQNLRPIEYRILKRTYVVYVVVFRLILATLFWGFTCYFLTLLILKYRGDSVFEHGVSQLSNFLKAERIDSDSINNALDYFSYWWKRTSGINMKVLMNERVGAIFREDMNYYFYQKTLDATANLLNVGEQFKRQVACHSSELYFLPEVDIVREMDLCPNVYILNRGEIELTANGEMIDILTKGSLFGHLVGGKLRPIRITATTIGKADVLVIPATDFEDIMQDDVKKAIAAHPHSRYGYINIKKPIHESPYNSLEYILRGIKAIRLPGMKKMVRAEENVWYSRWLLLVLLVNPVLSAALTFIVLILRSDEMWTKITYVLIATDVLHFIHLVTDCFSMTLHVLDIEHVSQCIYKYNLFVKYKDWRFYLDVISMIIPAVYLFQKDKNYAAGRLARLHAVLLYYNFLCFSFKTRSKSIWVKVTMFVLLIHALVCGYVLISCRTFNADNFPMRIYRIPQVMKDNIDRTNWSPILEAKVPGCLICSLPFNLSGDNDYDFVHGFLVPTNPYADYIIGLLFIISVLTTTSNNMISSITVAEIYYRLFASVLLYLASVWLTSSAISSIFTSYSDMYNYDYKVNRLLEYLKRNNVSNILRDSAQKYTELLWLRTKGNWLPKITFQAPQCLRQDILSALYMHHLLMPVAFKDLPNYFLRQLVVRLRRVVIFPGKTIVQEGDINPCIYFIHEGEVEKWRTDERNGDSFLVTVLTTNSYFGLGPGLIPNTPYKYSYYSRTVVDLVYLKHSNWKDLMEGYPSIMTQIMANISKKKKETKITGEDF